MNAIRTALLALLLLAPAAPAVGQGPDTGEPQAPPRPAGASVDPAGFLRGPADLPPVTADGRDPFARREALVRREGLVRQEGLTGGSTDGRSPGVAVLASLILPGMGELYAGGYSSGKYFTAADGVLWLALFGVDYHARSLRDDARAFAAAHAGFAQSGKDDRYYVDVGNFDDVHAYNEQALRDRDAYKVYDPASSDAWRWDSGANRELYRDRRVSADGMFNNTRFVVAALAVNRLLSAINAARIVVGGRGGEEGAMELGARSLRGPFGADGVALTLTRSF